MAIVKKNGHNNQPVRSLLSDFFNTEKLFQNDFFTTELMPAVNVSETNKNYEIELVAPGFKKDDFKVDLEGNVLNISAETKQEKEEKDKNYTRQEFSYSSFSRSFTLPENAQQDGINAKYDNGILKLTLDKKAHETAKKKPISVA